MNAFRSRELNHKVYICLGSNIEPEANIRKAVNMLRENTELEKLSTCWETEAFLGDQTTSAPNFINVGACILTPLDALAVKDQILSPIEHALRRVRTADKYAPRTIDLDITIYDDQVLDSDLWRRLYLILIFAELTPDLHHPTTGETLKQYALRMDQNQQAIQRFDILENHNGPS